MIDRTSRQLETSASGVAVQFELVCRNGTSNGLRDRVRRFIGAAQFATQLHSVATTYARYSAAALGQFERSARVTT
jgi:hypothetical protein